MVDLGATTFWEEFRPSWKENSIRIDELPKIGYNDAHADFGKYYYTGCWMLYASHIFDKYINKEHYPEIYRKGMREIEEEENQSQKKRSLY